VKSFNTYHFLNHLPSYLSVTAGIYQMEAMVGFKSPLSSTSINIFTDDT